MELREKISKDSGYLENICQENGLGVEEFWPRLIRALDRCDEELNNKLKGNTGAGVPILHSGEIFSTANRSGPNSSHPLYHRIYEKIRKYRRSI